jgi:hypothetical protein
MKPRLPRKKKHIGISVTDPDIDDGECADARHCAIALGIARKLSLPHGYIHVSAQALKFTDGRYRWRAFVSNRVLKWFGEFDKWKKGEGRRPSPFKFEASFEAYAHKTTREQHERINDLRNKRNAKLRSEGKSPKIYLRKERLVGANLAKSEAA